MAVSHIFICLLSTLLVFIRIVSCRAVSECPKGKYWNADHRVCRDCSPCPADVIRGKSSFFRAFSDCSKYKSLCPNWCSPETPVSNPNEGRDACLPSTPSPPVPFVNVTIDEPLYNATTNAYTATCSAFFSNMETPDLAWSSPSGQVLAPTDASGKWKVTQEEVVTQGVMLLTLQIKDFQEEDEGNYMCSAQGERSANQTVLLEYVEPPTTPSTPSPSPSPAKTPPVYSSVGPKPTLEESATPTGGISFPGLVGIAVCGVVLLCIACAIFAVCVVRKNMRTPRSRVADFEAHLLTDTSFVDVLSLEASDDFKSATLVGIQACFDHLNCDSVIIKHNKKMHEVQSGQDEFFIEHMAWNDSIEVYIKNRGKKKESIKILKMNCLKIRNVTETSAVVRCPSDENTFYLHYEEKDASGSSSSRGQGELIRGGSKEMCNLRPDMTYCVLLGIRGRTGDSGPINWVWKDTFKTENITFNPVSAGESSAKLSLTGHSVPGSMQLYYAINGSKRKQMTSAEMQFSSLVPDMDQVLRIEVKEDIGGSTSYRLLEEIPFKTEGSVKDGGDYKGYATTDLPYSDPDDESDAYPVRRKSRNRQSVPLKCDTGLLEAIHTIRDGMKYKQVYLHTPQSILEAVLDSLLEFLIEFKDIDPRVKPNVSTDGGMDHIESVIKEFDMQDYTGIFDLLKRLIKKEKVLSPEGISFAEVLLDAHYSSTCQLCRHAVFILKYNERKKRGQSSVC